MEIKCYKYLGDSGVANLSSNRLDASQALRNPTGGSKRTMCVGDEITYRGVDALLDNCFTKMEDVPSSSVMEHPGLPTG